MMSIPDYMITRAILTEHMMRQFEDAPDQDLPAPRRVERREAIRLAGLRRQVSAGLHALANRLEPRPATAGGCVTGSTG